MKRAKFLAATESPPDGQDTIALRPGAGPDRPARHGSWFSGRRPISAALGRRGLLAAFLLLVVGYLVLPPLGLTLWKSLVGGVGITGAVGFSGYRELAQADFGAAAGQTAVFVGGATVAAMLIGGGMAWAVARWDVPGRRLAYAVSVTGLAIPGIVGVLGWILLFGNGRGEADQALGIHFSVESMPGMIAVEGLLGIPIVFLMLVGPFQSMDSSLEEVASVHGVRRWAALRHITARLLFPAILSAVILTLIRAIQGFEVPLLLGVPAGAHIFTAEVYETINSSLIPNYALAGAFGTVLIAAILVLLMLERRVTRNSRSFAIITARGGGARRKHVRRIFRWLPMAGYLIVLGLYVLPMLYLIFASFERSLGGPLTAGSFWLDNYRSLVHLSGFGQAVRDSIEVALIVAIVVLVIGLPASWLTTRRRNSRGAGLIDVMAGVPLAVPGIVLGFGVLLFYLYAPVPFFHTIWILVVGFVAMFLPYSMRYLKPAIIGIPAELEEAGRVSGASGTRVARRILLPLVGPSAGGTSLYVFFTTFRELAMASLLVGASTPLLSTELLDTIVNGNYNIVAALGIVILVISFTVALIAFALIGLRSDRSAGLR